MPIFWGRRFRLILLTLLMQQRLWAVMVEIYSNMLWSHISAESISLIKAVTLSLLLCEQTVPPSSLPLSRTGGDGFRLFLPDGI